MAPEAAPEPSAAPDADRLSHQLVFLLEADRLKQVERRSRIVGGERRENTAEHSWHLALFALVLAEHADERIDVARVVAMVILHDLVEIDAGDTFAYDDAGNATKVDRERAAADRLFGLLPGDQAPGLRALWEEFETRQSVDARFAAGLDRMQPMLLNLANDGGGWVEHGITADQVRARNGLIADGSTRLWSTMEARLDHAVAQGVLPAGPGAQRAETCVPPPEER